MPETADNPTSRAGSLPLVGAELAFDFTNTASGRAGPRFQEHFRSPADVATWAGHARLLTLADHETLAAALAAQADVGASLLTRSLDLRQAIYAIGAALAAGSFPPSPAIDALARTHAVCAGSARLIPHDKRFVWTWDPRDAPIEAVLGPITLSALTLLTQSELARIKQCQGDHCGWLFFDTTKNKSRRWCEMEVCGNRAKQKRRVQLRK